MPIRRNCEAKCYARRQLIIYRRKLGSLRSAAAPAGAATGAALGEIEKKSAQKSRKP